MGQGQAQTEPGKARLRDLEAQALIGIDTPEAIRRLQTLQAAHPESVLNLQVANAVSSGVFQDKAEVQRQLDGYIKACAGSISLDGGFLSLVLENGTPEQVAWTAAAVRKRLESDTTETRTSPWQGLWSLEFKRHPSAEHQVVRAKIAEDLARMERSSRRQELSWMVMLQSGYQSIGDESAVERLKDEIVRVHPLSDQAKSIVLQKWKENHPMPPRENKTAMESHARAWLAVNRQWHKNWPEDLAFLDKIVIGLTNLRDTTAEDITAAVDEFFEAYRKNPNWLPMPPTEFRIAKAYVKHKIRLDQVPSLINDSYRSLVQSWKRPLNDDRFTEQARTIMRNSFDIVRLQGTQILLDCYAETKQPLKAKETLAELAPIDPSKPPINWEWELLSLRAQVAEIEGCKLDAWMLYRKALEIRGPYRSGEADELSDKVRRLSEELGGTQEGLEMAAGNSKVAESSEGGWKRSTSLLPSFSRRDFEGKMWDLARLRGKTLLINVWATWCAPCVAEHRQFQKLYDELKKRSDVAILNFTVDEDIGKIAPYMAKHGYTFPVLPAADLVNEMKPNILLPQNWLVSPRGKLEWEQVGYTTSDTHWQADIMARIEELSRKAK